MPGPMCAEDLKYVPKVMNDYILCIYNMKESGESLEFTHCVTSYS